MHCIFVYVRGILYINFHDAVQSYIFMYYIRISWINGNFMSMMCTHVCDFQFKQKNKDGLFLHASILALSMCVCEREIYNLNKNNKDDVPIIIFLTMIYMFIACVSECCDLVMLYAKL